MPIYLDIERRKARATTNRVMAAIEAFIGWMLFGPRQHDADLLLSLGRLSSGIEGERAGKR